MRSKVALNHCDLDRSSRSKVALNHCDLDRSSRSKVALSIFDLDHTLIKGNSSYLFGCYLYQRGLLSLSSLFTSIGWYGCHKLGFLSLAQLHGKTFNRFKGASRTRIEHEACQFVAMKIPELLYEPALMRLRRAQQLNHFTLLLSSSPDFLVSSIAQFLGMDQWHATDYLYDKEGNFLHLGSILDGEGKKEITHSYPFEKSQVFAYSDSHLDLPLLEAAGHAVGVNPNRTLRAICKRRGWEIL